jgi:Ca-activated chloride channel family protein
MANFWLDDESRNDERIDENIARKGKQMEGILEQQAITSLPRNLCINKLETTEIEELKFYDYDEKIQTIRMVGRILLLIEIGLRNTVYKSFI